MAASAGTAWIEVKPDMSGFSGEVSRAMSTAGGKISSFGGTLTKNITLPLLAAAGAGTFFGLTTAAGLEQAEVAFTTLTGSAEKGHAVMEDLKKLGAITPFETTDLTQTAQRLLNAGVATEDLTSAITFLGDAAGTQGAAGLDRLGFAYSQILGSGRAMTEDINQIADVGVPIWSELADQLGVTQGEVRKMASEGKISADMITKAFEQPQGAMKALQGGMEAQSHTLTGMVSTFKDTLGQGLADSFSAVMPQIKDALGRLTEAIGPALEAAGPAFTAIVNAAIPLIDVVADLLIWFSELSPQMQQWIVYALAGAAAAGPLISVFGNVIKVVGGVAKVFGGFLKVGGFIGMIIKNVFMLTKVFGPIKGFIMIFNILKLTLITGLRAIGLAFLTNPITWIILAIVAAIALAAYVIWRNWDTIKEAFFAALEWIKAVLTSIWNVIKTVMTTIWNVITTYLGFVFNVWKTVFGAIWTFIQTVWDIIVNIFTTAATFIWNFLQIWFAIVSLPFRIFIFGLIEIVQWLWNIISTIFQAVFDFILGIVQSILDFVVPIWQGIWNTVTAVVQTVWDWLVTAFNAVWNFIKTVFNGIKDAVLSAWNGLWNTVKSVWDTVYGWIKGKFDAVKSFLIDIWNTVKDKILGVWDAIKGGIETAGNAVKGVLDGIWNGIKSGINVVIGIINGLISGLNILIKGANMIPGAPDIPEIPKIPKLAEGGVVTRPTLAVTGEAGPEAVIPLSKLDAMLESQNPRQDIYLQIQIGDEDITRMIEDVQRREGKQLARMLSGGRRL